MNRRKFLTTSAAFVGGVLVSAGPAWANQAEARLEVQDSAPKGSEITIRMTVIHSSNNFFHYTEWAQIYVNGKEIARWDFNSLNLPENATFSREVKTKVEGNLYVSGKASCNLHGSANEATANVKLMS